MVSKSKWWTCPKCRCHKTLSDLDEKYIECTGCGRYFDVKGNEVSSNTSLHNLKVQVKNHLL